MKHTFILIPVIAVAMIGCNSGETKTATTDSTTATTATTTTVAATPAKEETKAPPMDSAAKMKAWMDYATPGDMHKMLASMSGKWSAETTMWEEEGKAPQMGSGVCENKMIMGGRYEVSTFHGTMMGMPFEGTNTIAYDNGKKKFISTWIDNMGTGMMNLEGTYDAAGKALNLTGKCVDLLTGKDMEIREVTKMIDDKHQVMEMYTTPAGGKEFKTMEIKYTKK
ncbi:hypothetical protein CJD36_016185 [Flavipsychrobacter stenotrophus]|uniref:DUF1579 domain-containing protein n=1 Tax=Flavipsychrobacter stenotrophus TaxID=2077091 RepID=A0A2S7SUC2_9BACT|nr:DUF1579 domain-containing protein [Flavipsychrobacter stenotrophus]PQJ10227.1 hypothetical protein CJD36_016185 [Flavipsychrobacter stenotrophus]